MDFSTPGFFFLGVMIGIALYYYFVLAKRLPKSTGSLKFAFIIQNIKVSGQNLMAQLTINQTITAQINPVDRFNKPASVEPGSVEWTSSDTDVATVEKDPENQLKAIITPVSAGVVQISVKADADLGEGVVDLTGTGALIVTEEMAVGLAIEFGTPVDRTTEGS